MIPSWQSIFVSDTACLVCVYRAVLYTFFPLGRVFTHISLNETDNLKEPSDKYENRHRFDPSFRWTWAEELPLIRRIDWKVTAWSCIAFFALDLDRSNLSQANTDNFCKLPPLPHFQPSSHEVD